MIELMLDLYPYKYSEQANIMDTGSVKYGNDNVKISSVTPKVLSMTRFGLFKSANEVIYLNNVCSYQVVAKTKCHFITSRQKIL